MRGTLQACFEISGRGIVVMLTKGDGDLRTGDWLAIDGARWRIMGIEMPNYFGKAPLPEHVRNSIGVMLEGATKAELTPLIGQPFETESSRTGQS